MIGVKLKKKRNQTGPLYLSDDADETILLQGKVDDGRTKRGGRRDGVTIYYAALPKAGTLPFLLSSPCLDGGIGRRSWNSIGHIVL
jgi:hypothetical protein